MTTTVLFDAAGPRGRRNVLIGTIVGVVLVVGLLALALVRLGANGQLGNEWLILLDPSTGVPQSLLRALGATVKAAALGILIAVPLAALLAIGRLSAHRWVRLPVSLVVEFFRAVPLLLVIFFLFLGFPILFGFSLGTLWALVLGLVLYNMAVIGEIFRAGILSIDRGQSEAAYALGLRKWQVMSYILVPQAVTRMLPVLVSQLVVLLKDTSLGFIIGYVELLRQARGNVEFFGSRYSLQLYVAATVVYIAINLLLSWLARRLERRRRTRTGGAATLEDDLAVIDPGQMAAGADAHRV